MQDRVTLNRMFSANDPSSPLRTIFNEEAAVHRLAAGEVSFETVGSSMYRQRRRSLPLVPRTAAEAG